MCKVSHFQAVSHLTVSPQIPCTCALPPLTLHHISLRKSKHKELPFLSISKLLPHLHQRCYVSSHQCGKRRSASSEGEASVHSPGIGSLHPFFFSTSAATSLLASRSACLHMSLSLGAEASHHISSFAHQTPLPAPSTPCSGPAAIPLCQASLLRSVAQCS